MGRGVPKAGFRMTKKRLAAGLNPSMMAQTAKVLPFHVAKVEQVVPQRVETEAEVEQKLRDRFATLDTMTHATVKGHNSSMIVSGPAGVGKSYSIGQILGDAEGKVYSTVIKGYVKATGLYKTLYEFRDKNSVIVFDDADSIFSDEVALNILKAACDTTKKRVISWLSETKMEDEEGERLPRNFQFEGSIIFITNYDFETMIARGNRLAPHFEAMISRSHYVDLAMRTTLDYVVRIKQVVRDHRMLRDAGYTAHEEREVIDFIEANKDKLRELSLRMVLKLASLMRINGSSWKTLAKTTAFKKV